MEYLESLFAHLHKKGVEKNKPGEICIISLYRKKKCANIIISNQPGIMNKL